MKEKTHLIQIIHPTQGRKVAVVAEPSLILLSDVTSVYQLVLKALDSGKSTHSIIESNQSNNKLEYDEIYEGRSEWKILPSFDNPDAPYNCIISGTGLTHKNSAMNRQAMHQSEAGTLTDSMKIYQWGLDGGKPEEGSIGVQPEWFYKGTGAVLIGHGGALTIPTYANDGGEEPEIAGVYMIDRNGQPIRIGFTSGNEFSDHVMEKKNYLYLAPSKLRNCSIGPELVLTNDFADRSGKVSVSRQGNELWASNLLSGEENMAHTLTNLEHHHFKYADHRQPLQGHVHFFGTGAFSFGAGICLQTGDEMKVQWEGMGRPLVNTIKMETDKESLIQVKSL